MPVIILKTGEKLTDTSPCADCMMCAPLPEEKKRKERRNARRRKYYQKNKARLRLRYKKWRCNNRPRVNAARRKYYKKNKARIQLRNKKWKNDNRPRALTVRREYYKNNTEKIRAYRQRCRCRRCNRRLRIHASKVAGYCVVCRPPATWGRITPCSAEPRLLIAPPEIAEYP